MLRGQSPSNFKLATSNLLSQNNQPNNVSVPAKSSPIYCERSALHTAPFTIDSPKDLAVPKVRQNCISRVTEQWAPLTAWGKKKKEPK